MSLLGGRRIVFRSPHMSFLLSFLPRNGVIAEIRTGDLRGRVSLERPGVMRPQALVVGETGLGETTLLI